MRRRKFVSYALGVAFMAFGLVWRAPLPAFAAAVAPSPGTNAADHVRCRAAVSERPLVGDGKLSVKCYLAWKDTGPTALTRYQPGVAGYRLGYLIIYLPTSGGGVAQLTLQDNRDASAVKQSSQMLYEGGPSNDTSDNYAGLNEGMHCVAVLGAAGSGQFTAECDAPGTLTVPYSDSNFRAAYRATFIPVNSSGVDTGGAAVHNWDTCTSFSSATFCTSYNNNAYVVQSPTPVASNPADWYPGGTAFVTTDGRSHGVECNGNIFQDTDGGWWVHLYSRSRDAVASGATRQKAWTGSWVGSGAGGLVAQPLEADTDNGVTVALPALSSMPSWGWAATYHERVQFATSHQGVAPANQPDPEDGLWANDAGGNPWNWLSVRNVNVATVGGGTTVSIAAPAAAVPYWSVAGPFLGGFNATSWLLDHFTNPTDVATLTPAAKAWAAKGVRYLNDAGTQVGASATYTAYEIVCTVLVKPDQPPGTPGGEGESSTINVYPPDAPGGTQTGSAGGDGGGSDCDAGFAGKIPIIGGVFDATARMVCGLGGALLRGLWQLLVPSNLDAQWSGLLDTSDGVFPFSIISGLIASVGDLATGLVDAVDDGAACFNADVGTMLTDATSDSSFPIHPNFDALNIKLPTPSDAGCTRYALGANAGVVQDKLGDVMGYRELVRNLLLTLLYVGFFLGVARAVVAEDPEAAL